MLQHCDQTAGVESNGSQLVLCLNQRNFSSEDTVTRLYDRLVVTVYGVNTSRTRVPLPRCRGSHPVDLMSRSLSPYPQPQSPVRGWLGDRANLLQCQRIHSGKYILWQHLC